MGKVIDFWFRRRYMNARGKSVRPKARRRALYRFSRFNSRRKQRQVERQDKLLRYFITSMVNARGTANTEPDADCKDAAGEPVSKEPISGTGSTIK
jgi:hypothetical protein